MSIQLSSSTKATDQKFQFKWAYHIETEHIQHITVIDKSKEVVHTHMCETYKTTIKHCNSISFRVSKKRIPVESKGRKQMKWSVGNDLLSNIYVCTSLTTD